MNSTLDRNRFLTLPRIAPKGSTLVVGLALVALMGTVPRVSAEDAPAAPAVGSAPAPAAMDIPRVIGHVGSLGYRDIDEVERKGDKLYEIKATDPQGRRVEITVDARSGEVLRSERDR